MKNISTNKIDNKNILIVKMDKSMLCEVSQIASKTLGSSFVNEDIFDNVLQPIYSDSLPE